MSDSDNRERKSASSVENEDEEEIGSYGLEFEARKSIRYHSKRKSFFETLNHGSIILSAVAGNSAFAALFGGYILLTKFFIFIAALSAIISATINFSKKAELHESLKHRFSDLLIKIISKPNCSNEDLVNWEIERLLIEQDEPPSLKALIVICYNEECVGQGRNEYVRKIPKFKVLLRHFWPFDDWNPID
jgi:hypothetical protein